MGVWWGKERRRSGPVRGRAMIRDLKYELRSGDVISGMFGSRDGGKGGVGWMEAEVEVEDEPGGRGAKRQPGEARCAWDVCVVLVDGRREEEGERRTRFPSQMAVQKGAHRRARGIGNCRRRHLRLSPPGPCVPLLPRLAAQGPSASSCFSLRRILLDTHLRARVFCSIPCLTACTEPRRA